MDDTRGTRDAPHLETYLGVLLRRRWVVLISFSAVLASTWIASLLMTSVYEATTTLQVEERELSLGAELVRPVEAFVGTKMNLMGSEVEIVKSRTIAEQVVRRLNLDKRLQRLPRGVSVAMTPIATDSMARTGEYTIVFGDSVGHYRVLDNAGRLVGQGVVGQRFGARGISFTLSHAEVRPGDKVRFSIWDFQSAVSDLRRRTRVAPILNTNIINVTMVGDSPERVAMEADAIAEAYAAQNLRRRTGQAFSAREFLDGQLGELQEQLLTSERELESYKTRTGVVTLGDEVQSSLLRLTQVEFERASAEAAHRESEALLARLRDASQPPGQGLIISTSGIQNQIVVDLSTTLSGLEIQRSSLEQVFTAQHPSVVAVRAEIEEAKKRLVAELEGSVSRLEERERALTRIVQRYEQNLRGLPQVEQNLANLVRRSKLTEGIYTFLRQKYEEARVAEASTVGNVRIIDPAIVPQTPVKPTTTFNVIFGGVVGLLLGVGLAFFLERLDGSIKSAEELERALSSPVFGVIPEIHRPLSLRWILRLGDYAREDVTMLLTQLGPGSSASEAYRSLRTSLEHARSEQAVKAFLVASAGPGEGKTTTAANLAIALAQMERRVLFVDADLRRPGIHRLFGCPQEPGLSDILLGRMPWRDIVHASGVQGLDLIPCGAIPPNPAELLGSKRVPVLLDEFKAAYDAILFDSPPALAFADSAIIATRLDGVLLVAEAGRATPAAVARVKAVLEHIDVKVMGAILNRARPDGLGYGEYYYYAYGDGRRR